MELLQQYIYIQCRRTKKLCYYSFETLPNNVLNLSDSLLSSDETFKGKFYQTMKKVSTSQHLDEEHHTPGHSAKLILVKPVKSIPFHIMTVVTSEPVIRTLESKI